jgi:hypothetical protein
MKKNQSKIIKELVGLVFVGIGLLASYKILESVFMKK